MFNPKELLKNVKGSVSIEINIILHSVCSFDEENKAAAATKHSNINGLRLAQITLEQ